MKQEPQFKVNNTSTNENRVCYFFAFPVLIMMTFFNFSVGSGPV